MLIRCWGSRGSIAVSGPQYRRYGGDTTCMEVRSERGDVIVVDAGSGIRCLSSELEKESVRAVEMLFTHAHHDHLMGFPFFVPLYMPKVKLTLRGPRLNKRSFRDVIASFLAQPYFPVQLGDHDMKARLSFVDIGIVPFRIGGITITPIRLSHPKNGGLGYKFEEGGKTFVFLTDNELRYVHKGGHTFHEYEDFCRGADFLIHDAEYNEREYEHILQTSEQPWGHSTFTDAVRLGMSAGVKRLGLFHLNQKRTDDQVDEIVTQSRAIISRARSRMKCLAVGKHFELRLK